MYQRAKGVPDTLSFGTRQDVHAVGYEWCRHSMQPHHVPAEAARVAIGGPAVAPQHVYSSSLLNVSGMSYGALSDNAILALNTAARLGGFSHNTGEGGISRFHLAPGGDIVWNIGSTFLIADACLLVPRTHALHGTRRRLLWVSRPGRQLQPGPLCRDVQPSQRAHD